MEGGRLDCQQMVELVTDYLEDALPPALRIAFDEHIRDCDGCQAYLAQMRSTVDTLRSVQLSALDGVGLGATQRRAATESEMSGPGL